ncbi:hypothetical protein BH20ACI2_BH20ACI2_20190 [soil metagenome]
MLAILYLILACLLGDTICRRYFPFTSLAHRVAVALLSGLFISSWLTYLFAYLFSGTGWPMLAGNLAFFAVAVVAMWLLRFRWPAAGSASSNEHEFVGWDWVFVGVFLVAAAWMMFGTFSMSGGNLLIGNHQWSDFGSNVSIMQSFAVGHNFPTEYPHFSGDRIRYHFLFYFLAGNFEYLGLNPAAANNVLSIFTLLSMLILVMTLGSVLFASRVVGRIGAALFFFHGSLAYIPFLAGKTSISDAIGKIWELKPFLSSGLPYRGEDWGVWSQVVYLNQRHLASSIGLLLIVIIFLIKRYQQRAARLKVAEVRLVSDTEPAPDETVTVEVSNTNATTEDNTSLIEQYGGFVLAGCLLGLLPMWNGAVFAGAAMVLAVLFLLLPFKKEMVAMAVIAGILALPQVLYLKIGAKPPGYSTFHWGYTVDDPNFTNVTYYLFFTFGFKWLLIIAALFWGTGLQRRIFAGLASLFVLTFCFQFRAEVLANHKFLNIWLVGANLFVGYGLVRLWQLKVGPFFAPSRILAVVLVALITLGGIIDLVVVKNSSWVVARFESDPFVEWVRLNTDPRAVFLSHRYVNHGILMTGRRLFYGHPYYAWGAGYPTNERDQIYKKMFESRNAAEIYILIKENGINYVAIDDALRKGDFVRNLNERVFEQYFPVVFSDTENRNDNLKVYLVPQDLDLLPAAESDIGPISVTPAANALEGGLGTGGGQFMKPRGISTDTAGNFYIADTGNSRVQKFSPDGLFLLSIGTPGAGMGQLREPNGVAIDPEGRIYVVDALNHKLLRFDAAGQFNNEWRGPEPGFYGPRDVVFGSNNHLYIVDQGRTRIVRFDPATESFFEWGTSGDAAGQFLESTGIEAGGGLIFVADLGNNRIQVFDLDGNIVRMWDVPEWGKYPWHYPDLAFDARAKRLYVTNGWKNELLAFDINGVPIDPGFERTPALANPSSIVMGKDGNGRRLLVLNTEGARVEAIRLTSP